MVAGEEGGGGEDCFIWMISFRAAGGRDSLCVLRWSVCASIGFPTAIANFFFCEAWMTDEMDGWVDGWIYLGSNTLVHIRSVPKRYQIAYILYVTDTTPVLLHLPPTLHPNTGFCSAPSTGAEYPNRSLQ